MDQVDADSIRSGPRGRRQRVRSDAFARHGAPVQERFETPVWLERSFVLPVQGETTTVSVHAAAPAVEPSPPPEASQPEAEQRPLRHVPAREWPGFVRPPSAEIDFATVVRRADACRLARRTALFALALTAFILGVLVLTGSTTALPLLGVSTAGVLVSALVRFMLSRAPIPHVGG